MCDGFDTIFSTFFDTIFSWDSRAGDGRFPLAERGWGVPYPPPCGGFVAGEISIVKSTLCGGRGWTSREIGVTGSLTPNSFDTELLTPNS